MEKYLRTQPTSLFDRFISRQRSTRSILGISLVLFSLPLAAVTLDRAWARFIDQGEWRIFLLPPVITIYILMIAPRIERIGAQALQALRPLLQIDDQTFANLVIRFSRIHPAHEMIAFSLGAVLGIVTARVSGIDRNFPWLNAYWLLASLVMYGSLTLTIYISAASTRLNAALHRQPLRFDILDPTPFEMIGRQSLLMALVYIGGMTLSIIFAFPRQNFHSLAVWIPHIALVSITVLIFFLGMRPTHQVMAAEKKRRLEPVRQRIQQVSQELCWRLEQGQATGDLAGEINALTAYEQYLLAARTWPYNTGTLRTLFFSIFIPLITVVARVVLETTID
jgi:hypothetical protein